jgi:hypothetical protein
MPTGMRNRTLSQEARRRGVQTAARKETLKRGAERGEGRDKQSLRNKKGLATRGSNRQARKRGLRLIRLKRTCGSGATEEEDSCGKEL